MRISFIKADWGLEHLGDFANRAKVCALAGFDGIETGFPGLEPNCVRDLMDSLGLDYVAMIYARDEEEFEKQLELAARYRPVLVNCQAGRDFYSFDRGIRFFEHARLVSSAVIDCDVVFETHRQTLLATPWAARHYLEALPWLRLTADLSHFTCVAETDLAGIAHARVFPEAGIMTGELRPDPATRDALALILRASSHIHARVGHAQGPQVADPRRGDGPDWTERFERWWDTIISACLARGQNVLRVNPEFGPPPYAPCDPATGLPFVDLWEVSAWICNRFHERWKVDPRVESQPLSRPRGATQRFS